MRIVIRCVFYVFVVIATMMAFSYNTVNAAQQEYDLCGKPYNAAPADQADYDTCHACLYNTDGTVRDGFSWGIIGCVPTSAGGLTQTMSRFSTAIIGGICFLLFLYGGFLILTSQGDPVKLDMGKKIITSSILALLIALFAVFIYRYAAQNIIGIPGLE